MRAPSILHGDRTACWMGDKKLDETFVCGMKAGRSGPR
jgi:hypothetical protein